MTPAPDGSFVRGVPTEYPRKEVRGLLPEGARFHADAAGNVYGAFVAEATLVKYAKQ